MARYFAYGRNMGSEAMRAAGPGHGYVGRAELRGHRLAFTRRSLLTGTGVADIVRAPERSVWGALYELDEAALAAIDAKEGNGWAYERRPVRVIATSAGGRSATPERAGSDVGDGEGVEAVEQLEAFAYAVIAPDGAHVQPSDEYVAALLRGARERGLPAAYVAELTALAALAGSP